MKILRHAIAAAALLLILPSLPAQSAPAASPSPSPAPAVRNPITEEQKKAVLQGIDNYINRSAYVPNIDLATRWSEFLTGQKEAIEKAKSQEEFVGAINNALQRFGFSHIVLHSPRAVQARINRSTVGIGIRIQPTEEGILVTSLVDDAPAQKAGLEVGDIILEADGVKVTGPGQIAGEEGTPVKLKVKKADGSTKEYTVVRRAFSTHRPEELTWVDKDTAAIRIWTFDLGYSRDRVEKHLTEAAKAKRLIVDLRGNPGGAVVNLMHFMNQILPKDTVIGTFIDRSLLRAYTEETKGDPTNLKEIAAWATRNKMRTFGGKIEPFRGQIAVLIDGGSGSAAEIAAAALKETVGAQVLGTKSAGAVLVSIMAPLPEGFQLQFPINDYVTVKGLRLEGNGVSPDVQLDRGPAILKKGEVDPAYQAAIARLTAVASGSAGRG